MKISTSAFYIVFLSSSILISGCAGIPQGKKIDNGGQYLQSSFGNYVVAQVDYPDPGVCRATLNATSWLFQSSDLVCSKISLATELPIKGSMQTPFIEKRISIHFKTTQQCYRFKEGFNNSKDYDVDCGNYSIQGI